MEGETRRVLRISPSPLEYWISTSDARDNEFLDRLKSKSGSLEAAIQEAAKTSPVWHSTDQRGCGMRRYCVVTAFCLAFALPQSARADIFGGDDVILAQILVQAIQTVMQLKSILETGSDTLNLLRDVNSGVRSGLNLIQIINPHFSPGVFGNLRDADSVLRAVEDIYGRPPDGADQDLIRSQDQSVAETISMNRNLYDFADQIDRERDRILFHADVVSPQGAGKLQSQALAVLIGVSTQILRTQSQLLKLMAENMAMTNRKEKLESQQMRENYEGLSNAFKELPAGSKLPRLDGGGQ